MISTVVTISCLRLWNNKQEVILLVALPILFFSIFAFIFSSGVGSNGTRVTVAYVDDDHSSLTQSVVRSTAQQRGIKVVRDLGRTSPDWPIQRLAKYLIASEDANFVVHFPEGFTDQLAHPDALPIRILDEGTNAVGQQIIEAILVQAVAQNSIPAPSDAQGVIFASTNRPLIETGAHTQHLSSPMTSQVSFASGNAFAENKHNPKIAMYAAGIAIMFLLFSANGAGGSLLEEKEAGTHSWQSTEHFAVVYRQMAVHHRNGRLATGDHVRLGTTGLRHRFHRTPSWVRTVGASHLGSSRQLCFVASGIMQVAEPIKWCIRCACA
jgi:ABC-2 type transport system permease protein